MFPISLRQPGSGSATRWRAALATDMPVLAKGRPREEATEAQRQTYRLVPSAVMPGLRGASVHGLGRALRTKSPSSSPPFVPAGSCEPDPPRVFPTEVEFPRFLRTEVEFPEWGPEFPGPWGARQRGSGV